MSQPNLEPGPKRPRPSARAAARVLLVDDSAEGRRGLARLLELSGFEIEDHADGTSAIRALREGAPPDIVLTDLFLPDCDGREVAEAAASLRPRPYIALITGWTLAAEDAELAAKSIDRIFLKPIDIRSLVEFLREVVRERERRAPS